MAKFHIPKNLIIDTITVPEFKNKKTLWKVFDEISKKHPYQGSEHEFFHWLREYLVDSDVKVWEGPQYTFFYREDKEFYQKYVDSCGDSIPLPKEEFFQMYLNQRHKMTVDGGI